MLNRQITIVVGLIRNDKGEVLLGTRNQPESAEIHGKLEFPGGGIEFGETPEQALLREVREETGLEVEIIRLLPKVFTNVWHRKEGDYHIIILAYECKILSGVPKALDDEITELKFFRTDEVDYSKALPKTKEIIALLKS